MPEHKEQKTHDNPSAEAPHHHVAEPKKEKEIAITLPEIKGPKVSTITAVAAVLLLIFVVMQAIQTYPILKKIDAKASEAAELARPAAIELTSIDAECGECAQLASVIDSIATEKINITKQETLKASDAAAKALISKYGVKRLPTIILRGETGKAGQLDGFTKADDALVYTGTPAPYVDAATGRIKGLVSVAYINATGCSECPDLVPLVEQLESQVKVKSFSILDKDSQEAKRMIVEQSVGRLPALFFSSEIMEYPVGQQLASAGALAKNGMVMINANPPYINITTGKVDGIASLILLNDSGCKDCYDVTIHVPIVTQTFQVYLASTKAVDISSTEGKSLISKYGIDAVPTLLITGDAAAYDSLTSVWQSVGTIEKDGAYVFRAMAAIPGMPYMNLTTGEVEPNLAQITAG